MKFLFYLILAAGIGNTVLRPELENPFTLYRLIAPIGLLAVLMLKPMMVVRGLAVFGVFFAYNFILATAYSSDYSQFFPSIVHYLYLFILLVLMAYMKSRYRDFDWQFLRFVQGFYWFLLLNLVLEFFVGSYYPNLYVDESDERALRAFFWNQNDLAVVLCMVAWFALAFDRFRGVVRWGVLAITVLILYYNDSKAALLSLLLISVPVFLIMKICKAVRIPTVVWVAFFSTMFGLMVGAIVSLRDVGLQFANETYTVGDLLVQPIISILTLEASGEEWGSLNNRTDAAIFVIIEYLRSYGFGLGAGGSWLVLSLPQYQLGGAQSPHNALLQFTVDFGYPIFIGYLYLTGWALKRLFKRALPQNERLKVIAILSFPMLGLSQSGAIVTNYFFFASIYFIWMLDRRTPFTKVRRPVMTQVPTSRSESVLASSGA